MGRALAASVIAAFLLVDFAQAQDGTATGLTAQGQPAPTGLEQTWRPPRKPLFSLFGLPVMVGAPVATPYDGAFRTFGGPPPTAGGPAAMRLGP